MDSVDRLKAAISANMLHKPERMSTRYPRRLHRNPASDHLVVCLSSGLTIQTLLPTDRWNILYLADSNVAFFLESCTNLAAWIASVAKSINVDKVLLTGASKGGFGAILLAGIIAKRSLGVTARSLAFSPQTRLDPARKRHLHVATYRLLLERLETSPELAIRMKQFGDLKFARGIPNCRHHIVYGSGHTVDSDEALYMTNQRTDLTALPISFHNSMLPYSLRGAGMSRLNRAADVMYARAANNPELADALPAERDQFVRELLAMDHILPLADFVDQILNDGKWT